MRIERTKHERDLAMNRESRMSVFKWYMHKEFTSVVCLRSAG